MIFYTFIIIQIWRNNNFFVFFVFSEFGKQLIDQQRILDGRTENKSVLINDLQEFFKRRSEIDMEYGKSMDRLCDRFSERFQKQRSNYGLNK